MNKFQVIPWLLLWLGSACAQAVQVFVYADEILVIDVNLDESIGSFREKIKHRLAISHDNFYLMANASLMTTEGTLRDFSINECSSIFLNFTTTPRKIYPSALRISGSETCDLLEEALPKGGPSPI